MLDFFFYNIDPAGRRFCNVVYGVRAGASQKQC